MIAFADMATPALDLSDRPKRWLGHIPSFALHILIIYILALHISSMLVGYWFAWVARALQFHTTVPRGDWYLQHFEVITIVPAFIAGCVNVVRFIPAIVGGRVKEARREPAAAWAWTVPTLILIYKIVQYAPPSSVLFGSSMSAARYFFDIQRVMPRFTNVVIGDPIRVWAQMSVTGPFYAGVAYSLAAFSANRQLLKKIFAFEHSEGVLAQNDEDGETTPAQPSSSPDLKTATLQP
jgi:hypothetical protein